jgi:hypothetical protein
MRRAAEHTMLPVIEHSRTDPWISASSILYDNFTHGAVSRRVFLDRLSELAGSTAAAAALLPLLQCDYSRAASVAENDPRLRIDRISYESAAGKNNGYLARAKDQSRRPAARGLRRRIVKMKAPLPASEAAQYFFEISMRPCWTSVTTCRTY